MMRQTLAEIHSCSHDPAVSLQFSRVTGGRALSLALLRPGLALLLAVASGCAEDAQEPAPGETTAVPTASDTASTTPTTPATTEQPSGTETQPTATAAAGGTGGDSAGAAGASDTPMAMAGNGGTESAGEGGGGGSGGTPGMAGAGGTAGQANDSFQSDPGTEGNGDIEQPGPYNRPEEVTGRLNGAPQGKRTGNKVFRSPAIFEDWYFRYNIYVPAQYEAGKPAALLIVQDGQRVGNGMGFDTLLDNLIHEGSMPVTIAVHIDPGTKKAGGTGWADTERAECYDTVSDRYPKMLLEELLPEVVLKDYDIVEDPDGWALAGHSSGATAAFTGGWFFPDRFRKIIAHNGSFTAIAQGKTNKPIGADAYEGYVRDNDAKPLRVQLLSGTRDLNNNFGAWLPANRKLAEALEAKGYNYRFVHGTGGHDLNHATADLPEAMRWMWRGFKLPHYE